jgi:hypothetical protein
VRSPSRRQIGVVGTIARVVIGIVLLLGGLTGFKVITMNGRLETGFQPLSVGVGLIAFPAVMLAWQWLRARRNSGRLEATGPIGLAINALVGVALYATPWYLPPLGFTSNAILLFYGASMLLAALWGYAGCEVTAVSNWLLKRDDQVGCVVFGPVDAMESQARGT